MPDGNVWIKRLEKDTYSNPRVSSGIFISSDGVVSEMVKLGMSLDSHFEAVTKSWHKYIHRFLVLALAE